MIWDTNLTRGELLWGPLLALRLVIGGKEWVTVNVCSMRIGIQHNIPISLSGGSIPSQRIAWNGHNMTQCLEIFSISIFVTLQLVHGLHLIRSELLVTICEDAPVCSPEIYNSSVFSEFFLAYFHTITLYLVQDPALLPCFVSWGV
jgi:hypothetical protein